MADSDETDRSVALARELERLKRSLAEMAKAADETDRSVEFARGLNRLVTRLTAVEGHLQAVSGAVRAAIEQQPPAGPSASQEKPPGPVSWLLLEDADRGLTVITDLCDWLDRVYLRFSDAWLPTCWLWHPDVIEELLSLRHLHAEAYPTAGPPIDWRRAGDWLDRYRPRVVERVRRYVGTCELSDHRPREKRGGVPQAVPLVSAANRLTEFWTRADSATAPRPEPTDAELTESLERNLQTT